MHRSSFILVLAACASNEMGAPRHESIDATFDATADTSSPRDASQEEDSSDAHPGVDPCTDCILLRCPKTLAACLADPPCASGWSIYERCRSDGGTLNCNLQFFQQGQLPGDVLVCGAKACSGSVAACP